MSARSQPRWAVAVVLVTCAGIAVAAAPPSRQTAETQLRLVESGVHASSADGRFALTEASATVERTAVTADGRFELFELRQPAVGCDPQPDGVFADGFE
jgi:hypothetical protein